MKIRLFSPNCSAFKPIERSFPSQRHALLATLMSVLYASPTKLPVWLNSSGSASITYIIHFLFCLWARRESIHWLRRWSVSGGTSRNLSPLVRIVCVHARARKEPCQRPFNGGNFLPAAVRHMRARKKKHTLHSFLFARSIADCVFAYSKAFDDFRWTTRINCFGVQYHGCRYVERRAKPVWLPDTLARNFCRWRFFLIPAFNFSFGSVFQSLVSANSQIAIFLVCSTTM